MRKIEKPIQIRKISESDENAILNVYIHCEDFLGLGPVATASMEMVRKDMEISMREGGKFCGVFSETGEMMGIVDYVPQNYKGNPQNAFLSLLMISRPFRNQGIGRWVVNKIEKEIRRNKDVKNIFSAVQVNNPRAIKFWRQNGYRIISEPVAQPDQTITYALQKRLG